MKKYTFLSFYKESEAFTKDLMDLGVVHIVESENTPNKEVQKLTLRLKNARTVLKGLKKRKVKQRKMAHEVK
ncbi:MAG: hypothetical protein N4A46_15220 [Schleiferiaceae bacterium]|nr:hypothetical protein [Schleiferiaceae bacterium]